MDFQDTWYNTVSGSCVMICRLFDVPYEIQEACNWEKAEVGWTMNLLQNRSYSVRAFTAGPSTRPLKWEALGIFSPAEICLSLRDFSPHVSMFPMTMMSFDSRLHFDNGCGAWPMVDIVSKPPEVWDGSLKQPGHCSSSSQP
jgi:hypothetical protein